MPTTHANSRELLVVPFAAVGIGAIAECDLDGSLLPHSRGGGSGVGRNGSLRPGAWRKCSGGVRDVRAAKQRDRFDGFSIGSNDLSQLTLGLDRDSALVAELFDERHPAVKAMIRLAIQSAKRCGRKIGICGQAPSDYHEFARFLVEEGIDSISLNPDAVIATRLEVARIEASLA